MKHNEPRAESIFIFLVVSGIVGIALFTIRVISVIWIFGQGCYELSARKIDFTLFLFHFVIAIILLLLGLKKLKAQWGLRVPLMLVGLVFTFLAIEPCIKVISKSNYEIDFEQEKWRERVDIRMARNLVKTEKLLGKSKDEVQSLLGAGEKLNIDPNSLFYYAHGMENGLNLTYFRVGFSKDKVINVELYCMED